MATDMQCVEGGAVCELRVPVSAHRVDESSSAQHPRFMLAEGAISRRCSMAGYEKTIKDLF